MFTILFFFSLFTFSLIIPRASLRNIFWDETGKEKRASHWIGPGCSSDDGRTWSAQESIFYV